MARTSRPPNRRLAWERLQRGWSHEELRNQLVRAMKAEGESDTGLSRNTVRRWETGERVPEPRYRKYLVLVFGKPADQLGLLDDEELALRPTSSEQGQDLETLWRLVTVLGGGREIDRETFLRGLLALGASPLLPSLLAVDGEDAKHSARLDREVGSTAPVSSRAVHDFEAITAGHRRLYWSVVPAALYGSVKSHVELGTQLLAKGGSDPLVQRVAVAVGESAMLAGRIAFFDLKRPEPAQADYELALEATEAAGDHALAAAVLAHMSFISARAGDSRLTRALMDSALAHSVHHTGPVTRAWLRAVESEVSATLSDHAASLGALSRAEALLGADEGQPEPEWLDFFNASRLAGFAGSAHLALGQGEQARPHLEQSLAGLPSEAAKQRAVVLADLAATYLETDLEAACALTAQALEQLQTTWYATGYERVQSVRRQLAPHQQNGQVRELEDRIRDTLPAVLANRRQDV